MTEHFYLNVLRGACIFTLVRFMVGPKPIHRTLGNTLYVTPVRASHTLFYTKGLRQKAIQT